MRHLTPTCLALASGGVGLFTTGALAQDAAGEANATSSVFVFVVVIAALIIFFIPTIVAFRRRHPNRWPILLVNAMFGGTGLGWFGALIWASNAVHKSETGSQGGESGLNVFVNDPKVVQVDWLGAARPPVGATVPAGAADPMDQLSRLQSLFDDGVIDAEEHRALRRPLIEQLIKSDQSPMP